MPRIAGPNYTATFKYDALNRRIEKTVNASTGLSTGSQTIQYLYDGPQAIAEITGSAITATYLTGLQLDEVLARYAGTGNKTLLTDALGSVIAQTNDQQGIQNFYAYTPYGEAQPLGPDDNNPIQYTARENDQTGLYYYRARYYDPVLKRFIQEDPIGLQGGLNVYAYVSGNPLSYTDPTGEFVPLIVVIPVIGGAINAVASAIETAGQCNAGWGDIAAAAGRGFVSGAIGTAVGLGVGIATKNPALTGSAAGLAENITSQFLSGRGISDLDPVEATLATGFGAVGGVAAHAVFPSGPGRPASLLRPRDLGDFGPKSLEQIGREATGGTVTSGLTAAENRAGQKSCGCRP